MTESQSTVLLIEIGIVVLLQAVAIFSILFALKNSASKVQSIAEDIHKRTIPVVEAASAMLQTARPQIETIVSNLAETSSLLKDQAVRIDQTVTDVVDRTRLQVVRADELVSRTMDKVETTTDFVQQTVISPVRQIAGVLQALNIGINVLFGKRRSSGNGQGVPRDEMFI